MTSKELIDFGFKKVEEDEYVWYELKKKNSSHRFLTNDKRNPKHNTQYYIGYENTRVRGEETYWFNRKLRKMQDFIVIYQILIY